MTNQPYPLAEKETVAEQYVTTLKYKKYFSIWIFPSVRK